MIVPVLLLTVTDRVPGGVEPTTSHDQTVCERRGGEGEGVVN